MIQEAKKRLEERKLAEARAEEKEQRQKSKGKEPVKLKRKPKSGVPKDKDQENFTDPDSRIMKRGTEYQQSYNAQIAVDSESRLIVATKVGQCAADSVELLMVTEIEKNTGDVPDRLLADSGYMSEANFRELERRNINAYVSVGREGKKPRSIGEDNPATERMRRKLRTKDGHKWYGRRKHIAEPPFGWLKQALGFRSFLLRGAVKVRGEFDLACLALNLKRMNQWLAW